MNELLDRLDPGFMAPVWLLLGLVAVVAVVLLEIGAHRRRRQATRLFAASHLIAALTASVSPVKRLIKALLLVTAIALLFIAMARPHLLDDWREENRSGLDLLLAVDCSKSMLTEDVKPNRLGRAQLAIADFADRLPDDRLGLIAFAGDAFLQCPMTLDHDAFQSAVRELDTNTIPRPGTDLAAALDEAVDALRSQPNNLKLLILVTDGEDLEGRVLDAAKNAAQNGIKIYTVGVGTPAGGLIPEIDDAGAVVYHHDASGQLVQSKLDETTLRQIADLTGGAYVPLGQRGEGLDEIYNRYIAPLPKHNIEERREKIPLERFEWPLGLALLFLAWEFVLSERANRMTGPVTVSEVTVRRPARRKAAHRALATVPALVFCLLSCLGTTLRAASADKAEEDYKTGKYEDAMQNYRDAAENQPNRNDLDFNLGDAAYKAGEFNQAEEAYRKALETPDLNLQEQTYYNLGNAQFEHGQAMQKVDEKKTMAMWEQALHSYDSALKLKTTADAKHNYEVVKEKLEQLKKKQQQEQEQKKNGGSSDPNQKNQSSDPSQDEQNNPGNQGDLPKQNPSDGQDPSQNKGDQPQPQPGGKNGPDQNQKGAQSQADKGNDAQRQAYSGTRSQDKLDPQIRSRQEAEDLLDSLKDDEKHVTARTLNGDNQPPPPPPSGKDW